ncbi:MAG: hypothetical protein QOE91_884, partial [Gaiellaceae bacterium]|nr:hypothetical protein [Gaiellaceae bacterium]
KASDPAGNVGVGPGWSVLVDRTGPDAPSGLSITSYDAETHTATVAWEANGDDPNLPTGEPGSGVAGVEYRYQLNGGDWTDWKDPDAGEDDTITPGFDVPGANPGDVIGVETRETDAVGNIGPVAAASLTLVGDEQGVDDLPAEDTPPAASNPDVPFLQGPDDPEQSLTADDGTDDPLDFDDTQADNTELFSVVNGLRRALAAPAVSGPCQLGPENAIGQKTLTNGVGYVNYPSCIVFTNDQATWTIYKDCHQEWAGDARRGVGPGYVAVVDDGSPGLLVNDFRWREGSKDAGLYNVGNIGATNGGLGTFEIQYARGRPGATPAGARDPVTGDTLHPALGIKRPPQGILTERGCATADDQKGYGVYDRKLHLPTVKGTTIRYQMEVWLKDPTSHQTGTPDSKALVRVQHQYRFTPGNVEAIHSVTIYGIADEPAGAVPMGKEPKFSASLRGDGRFNEIRVFSTDGTSTGFVRGQAEAPKAVLYTRQAAKPLRVRVRWGCTTTATNPVTGTSPCPAGSSPSNACVDKCFNVVARSRVIPATSLGDPFLALIPPWQNKDGSKASGLDGWARKSAALSGTGNSIPRRNAYLRDTTGDDVVTNCSYGSPRSKGDKETKAAYQKYLSGLSEHATVGMQSVRRREIVGWKDGATSANGTFVTRNGKQVPTGDHPNFTYNGSGVLFNGWEGARGPYDCEPLQVAFGAATETYSTYARYYLTGS